jgi:hypothetical protein
MTYRQVACKGDWRWGRSCSPTSPGSAARSWHRTRSSSSTSARTTSSARASTTRRSPPGSSLAIPPTKPGRSSWFAWVRKNRPQQRTADSRRQGSRHQEDTRAPGAWKRRGRKALRSFAPLRASRGLGISARRQAEGSGPCQRRSASPSSCATASASSPSPRARWRLRSLPARRTSGQVFLVEPIVALRFPNRGVAPGRTPPPRLPPR